MLSVVLPLLVMAGHGHARGFNESNNLGVENFGGYSTVFYDELRLRGIVFSNTNGGSSFASWASTGTCTIAGQATSGAACITAAIQGLAQITIAGVMNTQASARPLTNIANSVVISKPATGSNPPPSSVNGYYNIGDKGQGPSCSADTDDVYGDEDFANGCFSGGGNWGNLNPGQLEPVSNNQYRFPGRDVKITCKSGCVDPNKRKDNPHAPTLDLVIAGVVQRMLANNYYSARFAISRPTEAYPVLARCRVTVVSSALTSDLCPDSIPVTGRYDNAGDDAPA